MCWLDYDLPQTACDYHKVGMSVKGRISWVPIEPIFIHIPWGQRSRDPFENGHASFSSPKFSLTLECYFSFHSSFKNWDRYSLRKIDCVKEISGLKQICVNMLLSRLQPYSFSHFSTSKDYRLCLCRPLSFFYIIFQRDFWSQDSAQSSQRRASTNY